MSIVQCMPRKHFDGFVDGHSDARIVSDCKGSGGGSPEWDNVHVEWAIGRVLTTRERNGYDDSDFYALVWTGEMIHTDEYATTRGWTYHNGATIDATPETVEAANAWAREKLLKSARDEDAGQARTPAKGKRVQVVKGRKVAKGTVGTVFWTGKVVAGYARNWGAPFKGKSIPTETRIGMELEDGSKVFLAAANVEVLDPEDYLHDGDELWAKLANATWSTWYGHVMSMVPGFAYVA